MSRRWRFWLLPIWPERRHTEPRKRYEDCDNRCANATDSATGMTIVSGLKPIVVPPGHRLIFEVHGTTTPDVVERLAKQLHESFPGDLIVSGSTITVSPPPLDERVCELCGHGERYHATGFCFWPVGPLGSDCGCCPPGEAA